MKTRVLRDRFQEKEIRPQEEFLKYLELINKDVINIFDGKSGNFFSYCPACESRTSKFCFSKNSFTFRECLECETIYTPKTKQRNAP